jgi:excisionase family DNA binding protein
MSQTTAGTMITIKQASIELGMSPPTLRKWIRAGYLRTVASSPRARRRKITRDELSRFVRRLERES